MPRIGCITGVYEIRNSTNDKAYIGSTAEGFKTRFRKEVRNAYPRQTEG